MLDPTEYTPECVRNALDAAEVTGSRNLAVLAAEVCRQRTDIDQMAAAIERQEPTREQWADWFRRCADKGQDVPPGERRGLRLAASHLEAHEVTVRDGKIAYLVGEH